MLLLLVLLLLCQYAYGKGVRWLSSFRPLWKENRYRAHDNDLPLLLILRLGIFVSCQTCFTLATGDHAAVLRHLTNQ